MGIWFCCSLLLVPVPLAAASLDDAARDLARRVLSALAPGETLSVQARALAPGISTAVLDQVLHRTLASRIHPTPNASLTVTMSENIRSPLLVAELIRNEESQVFLVPYDAQVNPARGPAVKLILEARMLWEQAGPILDLLITGSTMVLLEPSRLALYTRERGDWRLDRALPIPARPRPRDIRGRLMPEDNGVRAYLPGQGCRVSFDSRADIQCYDRIGDWPLDTRTTVSPVTGRNQFTSGPLPPFYSAARWGDQWLVATVAGPVELHNAEGTRIAALGNWGTDIATIEDTCSRERYVVGLRDGALVAFAIGAGNRAIPVTEPFPIGGRLTTLAASEQPTSLTAVVRLNESHRHAAYRISLACGR